MRLRGHSKAVTLLSALARNTLLTNRTPLFLTVFSFLTLSLSKDHHSNFSLVLRVHFFKVSLLTLPLTLKLKFHKGSLFTISFTPTDGDPAYLNCLSPIHLHLLYIYSRLSSLPTRFSLPYLPVYVHIYYMRFGFIHPYRRRFRLLELSLTHPPPSPLQTQRTILSPNTLLSLISPSLYTHILYHLSEFFHSATKVAGKPGIRTVEIYLTQFAKLETEVTGL